MKRNNTLRKKIWWRAFLRGYTRLALVVVGVFGVIGLMHPGFFFYGMRHLTTVLAQDLNINALVLPPPVTPVVTSNLSCNPLNLSLALDLYWSVDSGGGTFTYDIERNGLPLVSGLSSSTTHYLDTNMTIATTYTYVVRANGPMGPGFEDSAPITLTTPYNCDGLTPPTVAVTRFQGNPVDGVDDHVTTHRRQPMVVGSSNIPYANIRITIDGETRLVADVTANINGYWEWKPPVRLNYERSTMDIVATDPLNANRYAVTYLKYQIIREHENEPSSSDNKDREPSGTNTPRADQNNNNEDVKNRDASLEVLFGTTNQETSFQQGETIFIVLTPYNIPENIARSLVRPANNDEVPNDLLSTIRNEVDTSQGEIIARKANKITGIEKSVLIHFRLLDSQGNVVANVAQEGFLRINESIIAELKIPLYVEPGRYTIAADLTIDGVLYSKSQQISVRSLPVIKLSSGRDITYDEFIWNLGWISFIALSTLLIWLLLVFYEYWLFMKGKLYVDELDFRKLGFISRL